jgi:hypothetical protein
VQGVFLTALKTKSLVFGLIIKELTKKVLKLSGSGDSKTLLGEVVEGVKHYWEG